MSLALARRYELGGRPGRPSQSQRPHLSVVDPPCTDLDQLLGRMQRFASGLSRANDFQAAAWAGHGVGVEIGEVSGPALLELARVIVDYRAPCFVDSGAYGAFQASLRSAGPTHRIDFDQVHAGYDTLQQSISDHNTAEEGVPPPLFVMPDVVGDQDASLMLARRYRTYIGATIAFRGVSRALIPLHTGRLALSDAFDQLTQLFGSDDFVVGIPTNRVAVSPSDFIAFLKTSRPRAVHILGAMAHSRLTPRLLQIIASGQADAIDVSADANPLRSVIIQRGQGAQIRREALARHLGARARQAELVNHVNAVGGLAALRSGYRTGSPDRRRRILSLLCDLEGHGEGEVLGRYALEESASFRPKPPHPGMRD